MIFNPLEQFEVYTILFNVTNLSAFLIINLFVFSLFLKYSSQESLLPSSHFIPKESLLGTIIDVTKEQLGGFKYFPLLLSLFFFILISNLLGMIPYSFTPTSHLVVTIGFSFPILLGVTIIGVSKYQSKFFSLFLPVNTPTWLIPLLTIIELVSYIARGFSLGIRLFSNIVAGHSLMHIIGGFAYKFIVSDSSPLLIIFKLLPIFIISILLGLEIVISFLQAYVFTVITASYIKDVL